jgi:signal transduction histidine kinase
MSLDRIPIRVRMTLAFGACTAIVLIALGVFLHQRLADELDASLRAGLRTRAGDLAGQVARSSTPTLPENALIERGDDLAQILDRSGRIIVAAPGSPVEPMLNPEQSARAQQGVLVVDRASLEDDDDDVVLVAAPAGRYVAVVGSDLQPRDNALESLDGLLIVGIPIAVILASGAGFLVAGGGLRPVERMRRRAAEIGTGDLTERLPVPAAQDEVGRLAATLNAMLGRLQDGFARERTFVADASHELRTPIARLKAELELATSNRRTTEELRAAVRSSAVEVELLERLTNDLLVLARADQGRLPIRPESVHLRPFLIDVAARADLGPEAVTCPDDLTVEVDPIRLVQAVGNLLDNAQRHGEGRVRIAVDLDATTITIHVLDDGPGIPESLRPAAFDRFSRADEARESGGAGLGLSIVAAIAIAHGGSAGLGAGADVWLQLPRVA